LKDKFSDQLIKKKDSKSDEFSVFLNKV